MPGECENDALKSSVLEYVALESDKYVGIACITSQTDARIYSRIKHVFTRLQDTETRSDAVLRFAFDLPFFLESSLNSQPIEETESWNDEDSMEGG